MRAKPSNMADTMVKPRPVGGSISQAHRDVTDDRYRDLRKPRKVKFYCNGDRYFKGKKIFVTPHRYLTFNDLLNDLTGKLPGTVQLPYGVRQIFTPVGGRKIRDIDELQDGQHYVCGGFESFKTIPYGNKSLEPWTSGKPHGVHGEKDVFTGALAGSTYGQPGYGQRGYYNAFQPGRSLRNYPRKGVNTYGNRAGYGAMWTQTQQNEASLKPKVVTVIRNGAKPHSNVKILLNRRSVQSYEQLVKDISEAFGPKWKNNKVRKLFSIRGREIQGVGDFFRDDDVFIGIGSESLTTSDVQEILEELYPESPYAKNLMKEWEKTKKKQQHAYHARLKPEDGKEGEKSKIDSGLGSDESARDEAESEATFKSNIAHAILEEKEKKKKKRGAQEEPPPDESTNHRMERERVRYAEIERERARKRLAKRMETDRKILDEERRKKGLVPLKPIQDPFKKLQDDREKEQKDAREREREREEAARREAEEHQREIAKAEARARARARKAQQEADDTASKVIVVVKGDKEGAKDSAKLPRAAFRRRDDSDSPQRSPQRSPVRKPTEKTKDKEKKDKENEERKEEKIDKEKEVSKVKEEKAKPAKEEKPKPAKEEKQSEETDTKSVKDTVSEAKTEAEPAKPKPPPKEKTPDKPISAPPKTPKSAPKTPKSAPKTPGKDAEKKPAESDQAKDKEKAKHRQKSKIVRKTKLERQISSLDTVLEKYEPGKTLGDGNFAIVKTCKLKNTSHEFAMKIVDKSKLRGKEHMIENEIAIMKQCNHPAIVKLMEEYETKDEIYLIMELVKGGDLFDAITQSVKFDEKTASGMCTDVVNALFYLHSRDIVHRDLKPENLLVLRNKDGSISLKLADFGLAMEVHQPIYTVCGTPTYVAPEILSEIGYGLEVDMWAVGVITYILLCGFPPFRSPDRNQTELFEFIKAGEYDFLSPYWDNISRAAKDLISRLLIVDRRKRYTAVDVLVHPWVITFAGSKHPPAPMDEHRRSLRAQLDGQAKTSKAEYLALTNKADKAS